MEELQTGGADGNELIHQQDHGKRFRKTVKIVMRKQELDRFVKTISSSSDLSVVKIVNSRHQAIPPSASSTTKLLDQARFQLTRSSKSMIICKQKRGQFDNNHHQSKENTGRCWRPVLSAIPE